MNTTKPLHCPDRWINKDFILVSLGNFFIFLSFYALLPLLPFYLKETYHVSDAYVGMALSVYLIGCIVVRPLTGYALDAGPRRTVYLLAYFLFMLLFMGYISTSVFIGFVVVRCLHGFVFGSGTVSGSTLVSQLVPRSKLGIGLGIYGVANTFSLAIGPTLGYIAYQKLKLPFTTIFPVIAIGALLGLIMATMVKLPPRPLKKSKGLHFRSFFVPEGSWGSLSQIIAYIGYGALMSFVAKYASEQGLSQVWGFFFTCMAVGLATWRPLSGRQADKGKLVTYIYIGLTLTGLCFLTLGNIMHVPSEVRPGLFLFLALFIGAGFGILSALFNNYYVRIAPEHHRGAATAMFFMSNDVGIGLGTLFGGVLAQLFGGLNYVYLFVGVLCFLSIVLFYLFGAPKYYEALRKMK